VCISIHDLENKDKKEKSTYFDENNRSFFEEKDAKRPTDISSISPMGSTYHLIPKYYQLLIHFPLG